MIRMGNNVKQMRVAKKVLAGKTIKQAVKEEGYSDAYAKSGMITTTKTWKQLMDRHIPEDRVAEVHQGLLNSKRYSPAKFDMPITKKVIEMIVAELGGKVIEIQDVKVKGRVIQKVAHVVYPDVRTQKSAVELAYKLRGSFAAEKLDVNDTSKMSLEDIKAKIEEVRAEKEFLFNRHEKHGKSNGGSAKDSGTKKAGTRANTSK